MASFVQRVKERLAPPQNHGAENLCQHLLEAPTEVTARTRGCAQCDAQGTSWVDLRICLTCGEVGCCDSSPWKHAAEHAATTGHPVMRSFEPGETWRWCYLDEMLG